MRARRRRTMIDRPAILSPEVARSFQYGSVVAAHRHRPPYPAAVFDRLLGLLGEGPRAALDLGCGTGAVALPLVALGATGRSVMDTSFAGHGAPTWCPSALEGRGSVVLVDRDSARPRT